jgi:hypothetical protein
MFHPWMQSLTSRHWRLLLAWHTPFKLSNTENKPVVTLSSDDHRSLYSVYLAAQLIQ